MEGVSAELRSYVESSILPQYAAFDRAHRQDHAAQVIARSLKYAARRAADLNMAYVVAAYHDIGLDAGRATHHLVSAQRLLADSVLRRWFSEAQLRTMAEAIEDHRASSERPPRSLYGCIVAEADRLIDAELVLRRTVQYGLSHHPSLGREEQFNRALSHLRTKYGVGGYLKLWLPESDNAEKLTALRRLLADETLLRTQFEIIYAEELSHG